MQLWFDVEHLDVDRLLSEWRWLCPGKMTLIARTGFGHLFLRDEAGVVSSLDTDCGKLIRVAESESQFREMAETGEKRLEWFDEPELQALASRGLNPNSMQCIGFAIPLMFKERPSPDKMYLADIYEYVGFLGDINRQVSSHPDGAKVRLRIISGNLSRPK
jgi:hypothetical protein